MEQSPYEFHVRSHEDGTFDSICPKCFLTVARELPWEKLAAEEQLHECDAGRLLSIEIARQQMQQDA